MAGYEDLNDAQRLSQGPTFRLISSEKVWDRGVALTSRLQTFETEMPAEAENFAGLARPNRALIGKADRWLMATLLQTSGIGLHLKWRDGLQS